MNRLIKIFALAVASLTVVSCADEAEHTPGIEWGYTEYYESSIFSDYEPHIMSRTLSFNLNSDAADELLGAEGRMRFEVVGRDAEGRRVDVEHIKLYVNDEYRSDNTFSLSAAEADTVKLGFEFLGGAAEGSHTLYLNYLGVENAALDARMYPLTITRNVLDSGIVIIKQDVANPGNVIAQLIGLIILAAIIFWILIGRFLFIKRVKGATRLGITIHERGLNSFPNIAGCKRVVLTSKRKRQGLLGRLFTAKIHYEVNEAWTTDIEFVPATRGSLRMLPNKEFSCNSVYITKDNNYVLKNKTTNECTELRLQ